MTAERSAFALVECVAEALHPYRWWLFGATFGVGALPALLMLLGHLGYPALLVALITPRFGAPLLLTLFTWSWSGFLLCSWFAPRAARRPLESATHFQRIRHAIALVGRAWALLMLVVCVLSPVVLWLVVFGVLN